MSLRALVARALNVATGSVELEHADGFPPRIARPAGCGLWCSSASRGKFSALGLAFSPIGVDVEAAEDREPPWLVLHPSECAFLRVLDRAAAGVALARIWSVKEAYLKALGLGLAREPASFAARLIDEETAAIDDPAVRQGMAEARTIWREAMGVRFAISAVILEGQPATTGLISRKPR